MKYYIYHIEGKKIGCTTNLKRRVREQGYTQYSILETHDDIKIASDREIELQKQYGYRVDRATYFKSLNNLSAAGKLGGINGGKLGGTNGGRKGGLKGGKTQGNINKENGLLKRMQETRWIPIEQRDKDGKFIKEWKSASHVVRELGINGSRITQCCKGKAKTAGGYTFNYKQNELC